jgi:hypothetical protein
VLDEGAQRRFAAADQRLAMGDQQQMIEVTLQQPPERLLETLITAAGSSARRSSAKNLSVSP